MANEAANEVVIQIKVTEEEVKEKIDAAKASLKLLRKERNDLDKELKAGKITQEEYNKSLAAINGHITKANAAIKQGQQTLKEYAEVTEAAEHSLSQMREQLPLLNAQLSVHNATTKTISERITELNAELKVENAMFIANASSAKKLKEVLSELDDAWEGLNAAQRADPNVGGRINTLTKSIEQQLETIEGSRKGLKEYIRDIDVLGFNVGGTIDSFKSASQGVGVFTKAVGMGRAALLLLTAVPIVAFATLIYAFLTKSQKGIDFLAQATSGITNVFNVLFQKVADVGEALFNAFDNPKQALIDVGRFIEQNLINRFKALKIIMDGVRNWDTTKIGDGLAQVTTGVEGVVSGMKKAYNAGADLAKMAQDIERAEISLQTARARSEKQIERQKQIAEDTTKTTAAREKAARAAFAESQKIQNLEQNLQRKRIALAQAELAANKDKRDYQKKVAEEQAKFDEVEAQRVGQRTELQNQLNSIVAEGKAKALEEAKKVAQAEVDAAESALIMAQRKGEETISIENEIYKRQIELIKKRAEAEKVAVEAGTGAAAARKRIQDKADAEIQQTALDHARKLADIGYSERAREIESALALARKSSAEELNLRIQLIEAERNKQQQALKAREQQLKENLKKGILTQKEYREAAAQLEIENGAIVGKAARAIEDARMEFAKSEANRIADLAQV
ncbi:coiled-coil domain-containing protein, partial [Spirosoma flavus]